MKIFLIGWFGAGNMGDEAILRSELEMLSTSLPRAEFSILSFDPERTRKLTAHLPQVKHIVRMGAKRDLYRSDVWGLLKTFRAVNVVIIGGGGLFQDLYNHYPIPFFTLMALWARLNRKQLFLYCLGIGPLRTWIGKRLCAFAARLPHMLSVRDPDSYDMLRALGVTRDIVCAADPVLLLTSSKTGTVERLIRTHALDAPGPHIVVCIHELLPWDENDKRILAHTLDSVVRDVHAQIRFLPLGSYTNQWTQVETPDSVDLQASQQIAGLMSERASLITDDLLPQECLAVIERADLVLSMRFHGLVMGLAAGVPVIALTYPQEIKLRNLMRRIQQQQGIFEVGQLDHTALLTYIKDMLEHQDAVTRRLAHSVDPLLQEVRTCTEVLVRAITDSLGEEDTDEH